MTRLTTSRHGLDAEWVESRSAEHLCDLVRAAQDEDLDGLAVGGGDGTVALALGGLDTLNRVPLGVLPLGSGNDFARDLGIPSTPSEALTVLAGAAPRRVDVVRVSPGGVRYCCVAS